VDRGDWKSSPTIKALSAKWETGEGYKRVVKMGRGGMLTSSTSSSKLRATRGWKNKKLENITTEAGRYRGKGRIDSLEHKNGMLLRWGATHRRKDLRGVYDL